MRTLKYLTTFLAGIIAHISYGQSSIKYHSNPSTFHDNRVESIIMKALENGGIEVGTDQNLNLDQDLYEIIKQIGKTERVFEHPLIILKENEVIINDYDVLEEVMSTPGQTITSL